MFSIVICFFVFQNIDLIEENTNDWNRLGLMECHISLCPLNFNSARTAPFFVHLGT